MSSRPAADSPFLTAPMGRLFLSNALPMIVVMSMGGLLNLVDAAFLGHFVGADALAAVSIVFPAVMISIALSTLVSGGMSSLLARHLGAGERDQAAAVFARAHGLSLCLSLLLIAAFVIGGQAAIGQLAGARGGIAAMAHTYLFILICGTPVQFLLGVHADALRNEGRAGLMALMSIGVTLANVALDYLLIVVLDYGVAGSAWGTVAAQGLGLLLLLGLRLGDARLLPLAALRRCRWVGNWRAILALGAPLSLSFVGLALVSATVIATLRLTAGSDYADTVAAYGIATRVFGLAFLPQMAIALAAQSIVGNNVGAGLYPRSDAALRYALGSVLAYCLMVELSLLGTSRWIGAGFTADPVVVTQLGAILRAMSLLYLVSGPILVLALYFQAVGQPGRAAALTLTKPFLLSPALIIAFATLSGPALLWFAFPAADSVMLAIASALAITSLRRRAGGKGFGLETTGDAP